MKEPFMKMIKRAEQIKIVIFSQQSIKKVKVTSEYKKNGLFKPKNTVATKSRNIIGILKLKQSCKFKQPGRLSF